jgi:y4mF family transcriptional regulator
MERLESPSQLGEIVRQVRKAQGLRQRDLALAVPASHVFVGDVERGKPTVHLGKVLALLRELGIQLHIDVPEGTAEVSRARRTIG